jgi:HD-GYP domain-containing protein (c-di-GMP phosphodiesterase class II)
MVVDVWDALRSDRPYRKAWPDDEVLAYIKSLAGIKFDPRVVDMFLQLVESDVEDDGAQSTHAGELITTGGLAGKL